MSGGSMDYAYSHIRDAAMYIQRELANMKLRYEAGRYYAPASYYVERHQDLDWLKDSSGKKMMEEVIKELENALKAVRVAAIYAERVEWLTSGDDGHESFIIRTREQLADAEKHKFVE